MLGRETLAGLFSVAAKDAQGDGRASKPWWGPSSPRTDQTPPAPGHLHSEAGAEQRQRVRIEHTSKGEE